MNKIKRIIACSLILIILCTICSCSSLNTVADGNSKLQSSTTQSPQKATVAPKQLDSFDHSYNSLDDETEKEIYANIMSIVNLRAAQAFYVTGDVSEIQIYKALYAFVSDHPEIFWLSRKFSYQYDGIKTKIWIFFNDNMSSDELEKAKEEFNSKVDSIVNNAPRNESDYKKELYVNNYIINNCRYDETAAKKDDVLANENDAYGALIKGEAVCEGYAKAFQLLCNRLDIDCVMILGVKDNVNHAWNCIKIEDEWYHIDPTWNDAEKKYAVNDYFNLSDSVILADHTIADLFNSIDSANFNTDDELYNSFVPKCNSMNYNYYKMEYPTLYDIEKSDDIINGIAQAAKANDEYFSFVIDDSMDFESTADKLVEGYLSSWIDSANMSNWYSPNLNNASVMYKKSRINVVTVELKYI